MIRRVVLWAAAAALLWPASAQAVFALSVDGSSVPGHLRLILRSDPGLGDVSFRERGRPVEGSFAALPNGLVVPDGGHWKCSRRDRTFVATATGADGASLRSSASVRTPSCAYRLTLRTVRGHATVSDSFGLGGVHARLCARACRTVAVPAAPAGVTVPVRGHRVRLRTAYQRLIRRVGARPAGGPVVLATGDSLMQSLDVILQDRLARSADLRSDVKIGSALAYPSLYGPWSDIARAQVARWHPHATIVFTGSNDVYPIDGVDCCGPAWSAAYEQRARDVMAIYAQSGAGRVVWLTVPIQRDPRRVLSEVTVNAAVRRAAAAVPGVAVVPADTIFTPGDRYRARIGGVRVREHDGVHLSLAGARIAARAVLPVLRGLGL